MPVDAYVYGEYIVPGKKGKKVNILESYYNLRPYDVFNSNFLIYEDIKPNISIKDNKEYYIEKGIDSNRVISLIIKDNKIIEEYILNKEIVITKLIDITNNITNANIQYINNDFNNFVDLSKKLDNKICVINAKIEKICRENDYYLVKPNTYINNFNLLEIKQNISSGQIIYIEDDLSIDNFLILYNEILFKGYKLVKLSEMISE